MNEKKMGLMDLVFMGMGGCIGSGIFSMVGYGINLTGRSIFLAFLVAMVLKMSQQTRNIVTSSMFTLSGGTYSQQALILTPMLSGANALNNVISSFSFSVYGLALANYFVLLVPSLVPYQKWVASGFIVLFILIGSRGAGFFAKIQNFLGISKITALGLLIVFGLMATNKASYAGEPFFYNGTAKFLTAVALMSFTCDGITNICNYESVSKNPKRDIPRAWIIASVACAVIYALLGYVGSHVGSYSQVAGQNLGYFAKLVMPAPLYIFFVLGGAMASLSTALLGGLPAQTMVIGGIAQDGWIPQSFQKKTVTTIFLLIVSVFPILTGITLDNIVSMMMVPSMLITLISSYRAIRMPQMFPEEWKKNAFNLNASQYKALMYISMVTSALTGYFNLVSLTVPLAIGTVFMTIFIFVYSKYLLNAGKIHITSTKDIEA